MMDIEKLAREAGIQDPETYHGDPKRDCPWIANTNELRLFAALVAEDCARVAEQAQSRYEAAATIRERFKAS